MYRFDLDAGTVKPAFVPARNHDKMSPIIGNHDKMSENTDNNDILSGNRPRNHDKMSSFSPPETMTSGPVNHDISPVNHDTAMSREGTLKVKKEDTVKQQQQPLNAREEKDEGYSAKIVRLKDLAKAAGAKRNG